jgi:hypothetical protein
MQALQVVAGYDLRARSVLVARSDPFVTMELLGVNSKLTVDLYLTDDCGLGLVVSLELGCWHVA